MMLGQRTGHGAATVYHPGIKGPTMISGGDPASRERVREILAKRNLPVEVDHRAPVSAEVDKVLLNLIGNVLGTLFAATPEGRLLPLRVNVIFTKEHQAEILPSVSTFMPLATPSAPFQVNAASARIGPP